MTHIVSAKAFVIIPETRLILFLLMLPKGSTIPFQEWFYKRLCDLVKYIFILKAFWKYANISREYKNFQTTHNSGSHRVAVKCRKMHKTPCFLNENTVSLWQGHKDLNPEPTVLETAALPIELYPYILFLKP